MNTLADITDAETRLVADDHAALKLWLRLLACTHHIEAEVRSRLRTGFDVSLPRFDLLAQLQRSPEGLTMGELSQRLMVTGGNITALTDQLEAEQLVRRMPHPSDRRAWIVRLTPGGRTAFNKMAEVHEGWIVELLGGLSPAQTQQMHQLLGRLKQHLMRQQTAPE
jgi:DNA-binding MarR family transcriptional regulator